jgi:hypothetical protein
MGAHIERTGVAEGAPEWMDDPYGSLPRRSLVRADATIVALQSISLQAPRSEHVAPVAEPIFREAPGPAPGLRGPPFHG